MIPTEIVVSVTAVVLLVLVGFGIGFWLKKRRSDHWTRFARRHGLQYSNRDDRPKVEGRINERHVSLQAAEDGSDSEAGVVNVEMAIELKSAPKQMRVEATPGVIGDLVQITEGEEIEAPEGTFEREVLIEPHDDQEAQSYWTADRRTAFLRFVAHADCDTIEIADGHLIAEFRSIVTSIDHLEELVRHLQTTAERLDQVKEKS